MYNELVGKLSFRSVYGRYRDFGMVCQKVSEHDTRDAALAQRVDLIHNELWEFNSDTRDSLLALDGKLDQRCDRLTDLLVGHKATG